MIRTTKRKGLYVGWRCCTLGFTENYPTNFDECAGAKTWWINHDRLNRNVAVFFPELLHNSKNSQHCLDIGFSWKLLVCFSVITINPPFNTGINLVYAHFRYRWPFPKLSWVILKRRLFCSIMRNSGMNFMQIVGTPRFHLQSIDDLVHNLEIIRCSCQCLVNKGVNVNTCTTSFNPLPPDSYLWFDNTHVAKCTLLNFNSFHTTISDVEAKINASSSI